jgi:hypothetical protein
VWSRTMKHELLSSNDHRGGNLRSGIGIVQVKADVISLSGQSGHSCQGEVVSDVRMASFAF